MLSEDWGRYWVYLQAMRVLGKSFYNRDPLLVAPDLLGKVLVRKLNNKIISGRIVEVEAYLAFTDEAAHGFVGKTARNSSLFKSAGHAYVYSIHIYNCLDFVTQDIDVPSSVLIRALEPLEGIEFMKKFRNKENLKDLTSGPGKLCQALQITKEFDGVDITNSNLNLYVVDDEFSYGETTSGKRIGISKAKDDNFRFYVKNSLYVLKK